MHMDRNELDEKAEQLYEERFNDDDWEDDAEEIIVRPSGSEVVSFRVPSDLLDLIVEAAETARESVSEYVRAAVIGRLTNSGVKSAITGLDWSSTGPITAFVATRYFAEASNPASPDASQNLIPDDPPRQVALGL